MKRGFRKNLFLFCSTMFITYLKEMTYQDIPGYRYGANRSSLHADIPEESCFCLNRTKNIRGEISCHLDGTMDMYSALRK